MWPFCITLAAVGVGLPGEARTTIRGLRLSNFVHFHSKTTRLQGPVIPKLKKVFFCSNPTSSDQAFAERLPELLSREHVGGSVPKFGGTHYSVADQ